MDEYSLAHLSEGALLHGLKSHLARERDSLALVLAHLAEVEARELFKPAGYSSMQLYCVHELQLSKDAANKRIRAARLAKDFPVVFQKVAEGAIRLTSLLILGARLTAENVDELLAAATHRSDFEVREILAERFPQAPTPTLIEPVAEQGSLVAPVPSVGAGEVREVAAQPLQGIVNPLQLKPIGAGLYKATLTMSRAMREKLGRAKDLLGYRKSEPDEAEILEMGLDQLIARLEKQKFGATADPRPARRGRSARHIPNEVKRQVWERDEARCTFVGEGGTRCPETRGLEWDHIVPVARGGTSEASNVRLHCRAHNQLAAERVYGKPFIENKREQARAAAAKRKAEKAAQRDAVKGGAANSLPVALAEWDDDSAAAEVAEQLEALGYTEEEGRLAASTCRPPGWVAPETRRLMCLEFLRQRHGEQPDSMVGPAVTPARAPSRTGMDAPAPAAMRDPWTCGPALDPMAPGAW